MYVIALLFISLNFALDCPLTDSIKELDELEFIKSYKFLGYPFWVKSENRESVITQYKKRFLEESESSSQIKLASDYSARLVKSLGKLS